MPTAASLPPFEEVYREHFDFVWSNLRRLGVRAADLEDAAHDVFSVVHRRQHTYDGTSRVETWLFGILRRIASHHRRRAARHGRRVEALAREPRFAEAPDASLDQRDALRHVETFLDELDGPKREVFILAHFAHMTGREIAQTLAINPNTASARLRAARLALHRFVEQRALGDAFEEVWTPSERAPAPERARRRVLAALLPGVAVPSPPRASAAKPWAISLSLAAAAGVAVFLASADEPAPPPTRAATPAAVAAPDPHTATEIEAPPVETPVQTPPPPVETPVQPAAVPPAPAPERKTVERHKPKPAAEPKSSSAPDLDALDEQTRLARAVSAAKDPEQTLQRIDAYEKRFPNGFFGERLAFERLDALCALGRIERAKTLVKTLRRRYPGSTLLPRDIQAPCGRSPITNTPAAGDEEE